MCRLVPCLLVLVIAMAGCSQSEDPEGSTASTGSQDGAAGEPSPASSSPQTSTEEPKSQPSGKAGDFADRNDREGDESKPAPFPADSEQVAQADSSPSAPDENNAESAEEASEEPSTPLRPPFPERSSLGGRWILLVSQMAQGRANDLPIALMNVGSDDGKSAAAELLGGGIALPDPQLVSSMVDGDRVDFTFLSGETELNFRGRLKDGLVLGNVLFQGGRCDPARMVPTELDSLDGVDPVELEKRQALVEALRSDEPIARLRSFIEAHPASPLTMTAYEQLVALAGQQGLEASAVEQHVADYVQRAERWGPRMQQMARLHAGINLVAVGALPEVAARQFDEVEKQLTEETNEDWRSLLKRGRELLEGVRLDVQVEQAAARLAGSDAEEQTQAAETLRNLSSDNPFHAGILHALAEHAERKGKTDQAIDYYSRLVALPGLEQKLVREWSSNGEERDLPRQRLSALWKEKHGDTAKLDEHLTEVYEESIYSFADERRDPSADEESDRVVLCELFTGSKCPPCVAADVATGGLEKTFPRSELIVLRYHQHNPGPDPLTNEQSTARFDYYEPPGSRRGTPTIYVNGTKQSSVGGYLEHVKGVYRRLRETVDSLRKESSNVQIDLKADAQDGRLSVSADVQNLEPVSDGHRLRLVLAEEAAKFEARNGIRVHEMVVRHMPGGAEGIAPEDGGLNYSDSIKLADLKQQLVDDLATFEQRNGFEFAQKPMHLESLHLVAFVQNEETQDVLQAASVPVTGSLDFPEAVQPSEGVTSGESDSQPESGRLDLRGLFDPPTEEPEDGENPESKSGPQLTPPE